MRKASIGALVIGLMVLVASAQAGTVYTDLSSFLAQVQPGYYLETFQGVPLGVLASPVNFTSGGYSYSASAPNALYGQYAPGSATDVVLSTNDRSDALLFTFTSGNVTAVGGYFFATLQSGALVSGDTVLTLSDGTVYTLVNGTPSSFVGFTTSPGLWITSLSVDALDTAGAPMIFRWPAVNDLYVGQSGGTPEPATGALLAGGVLLLAALARRRKKA